MFIRLFSKSVFYPIRPRPFRHPRARPRVIFFDQRRRRLVSFVWMFDNDFETEFRHIFSSFDFLAFSTTILDLIFEIAAFVARLDRTSRVKFFFVLRNSRTRSSISRLSSRNFLESAAISRSIFVCLVLREFEIFVSDIVEISKDFFVS